MDWHKFRQIEQDDDLTAAEKYLMVCLLDLANGDKAAYPSLGDLSRKTGMTRTSISRITSRLQKEGKLAKKRRRGSSLYIVYPAREEWEKWAPEFAQEQLRVRAGATQSSRKDNSEFAQRETDPLTYPITDPSTLPHTAQAPEAEPPTPKNFSEWITLLRDTPKNRIAVLAGAFKTLFPDLGDPNYARIGKTAKTVGGANRLMRLLWDAAATQPAVLDCDGLMTYVLGMNKRRREERSSEKAPPQPDDKTADEQRAALKKWQEDRKNDE